MVASAGAGIGRIPRLEAALADTSDVQAAINLGVAYQAAGRYEDAARLLERTTERHPENERALFLVGLSYENLQQFSRARELYERYLAVGRPSRLKRDLRWRIPILRRRELEQAAQVALANEDSLRNQAPTPRTVAVFPFRFLSGDSTFAPLSRAMAEMLSTDLAQTSRLTVLNRTRVQLLVDELRLGESGLADSTTVARSGHLLGAETIVQGTIHGDANQMRLNAAVVRPDRGVIGAMVSEADAARELFDMETRLAFKIYEALGIDLTPAEREAISKHPTENLQALLAYGRGLQSTDAGDFKQAARHFRQAASIDPGFALAAQQAVDAAGMVEATRLTTAELAERAVQAAAPAPPVAIESLIPSVIGRDVVSEALGTEGLGQRTMIGITFTRP